MRLCLDTNTLAHTNTLCMGAMSSAPKPCADTPELALPDRCLLSVLPSASAFVVRPPFAFIVAPVGSTDSAYSHQFCMQHTTVQTASSVCSPHCMLSDRVIAHVLLVAPGCLGVQLANYGVISYIRAPTQ